MSTEAKRAFFEALQALVGPGELSMRLARAMGELEGLDESTIPHELRTRFAKLIEALGQRRDQQYSPPTQPPAPEELANEVLELFTATMGGLY
jgi:hypothetical protein